MKQTKFHTISGKTSLVGVLGDPIGHSLSPVIHNAALAEMGLNWCYLAIPCKSNDLTLVTDALKRTNCKGLNITIPHKIDAIKLCNKINQIAKEIGAVNTLIPDKNNNWVGENTDIKGFMKPLEEKGNWAGKTALILGTGGSARAVALGLKKLNIYKIIVMGRTENKINAFIKAIKNQQTIESSNEILGIVHTNTNSKEYIQNADLIINATPAGMYDKSVQNIKSIFPFGEIFWETLDAKTTLYDLIYNPRPTEWLKLGRKRGCDCIDGLEMLIQQGAASLTLWSGFQEIPIDIMRSAAIEYLIQ